MNVLSKAKSIFPVFKGSVLKKQLKIALDGVLRPISNGLWGQSTGSAHAYPVFPYGREVLYDLAYNSDTLLVLHKALRTELFRNGYELAEAEKTDQIDSQEELTGTTMSREKILKFLENCNENGQDILEVCKEIEDDFSIRDDGFMLFLFDYVFSGLEASGYNLKEIVRADPRYMGLVINKFDRPGHNDDNVPLYACYEHRDKLQEGKEYCTQCGKKCELAYFFTDYSSTKTYYFKHEVIHKSKYRPSKRFGYSPILTSWQKVRTLLFMDKYIMELYDGQRPPKAGLFFKTSNYGALEKMWEGAKKRAQDDPHMPIVMGVPDTSSGKGFVEFIDFMRSLSDLQNVEMRNEYRTQVGAIYGVMPIFQGDMSQGGGLNNEGLEITITNRATEEGQNIYNKYFFPHVLKALGAFGWSLTLNPSEEQDEKAKLEREKMTLENGKLAKDLGLEAEYEEDTGEVIIKSGPLEKSENTFQNNPFQPNDEFSGMPEDFAKVSKAGDQRPPFSKLSEKMKEVIEKFMAKFNRKPTEEEMQKELAKINFELEKELKSTTKDFFEKTYKESSEKVNQELGIKAAFNVVDQNALETLKNQDVLNKAFAGIAENLTDKVKGVIEEAFRSPEGLTPQKMTEKIKEATKIADHKAENIARTESGKVSSAARMNSYKKSPDFQTFKFKWIGPDDLRTTETSKRIKNRTKGGVSWDELVKIVTEESTKDFPDWTVDKEAPMSHYQSRHTFVRVP